MIGKAFKVLKQSTRPLSYKANLGRLQLHGVFNPESSPVAMKIFNENAINITSEATRKFGPAIQKVLAERSAIHKEIHARVASGQTPLDFNRKTAEIREDVNWKVAETPAHMQTRHVEITGPASDPKMVINMLNSGADTCMIDMEDSMAPTQANVLAALNNIYEAARGSLTHEVGDKKYRIKDTPSELMVRVRGLHMREVHATLPHFGAVPALLFDTAMHLANNGSYLASKSKDPVLYVPKLQTAAEAEVIDQLLSWIEKEIGLKEGSTKLTTLIETLPAAFQTHEIAKALEKRLIGQNCGRWDWLANRIYHLSSNNNYIHPNREHNAMSNAFNMAYSAAVVQTAHQRGFHGMGGMSALIPVSGDAKKSAAAMEKVAEDKGLEISNGHDGAWVAHPAMVKPVKELFMKELNGKAHQKDSDRSMNVKVSASDLLEIPTQYRGAESRTEAGLRYNVAVAIEYMYGYLGGNGAVAINNMMEDLATFEMGRHHVRSWVKSGIDITHENGEIKPISAEKFAEIVKEEFNRLIETKGGNKKRWENARDIFLKGIEENPEYISDIANEYINPKFASAITHGNYLVTVPNREQELVDTGNNFKAIRFHKSNIESLKGNSPRVSGIELTKQRGQFLTDFVNGGGYYKFMGTADGVAAVNTVAGGRNNVGPYIGGWQINAMGLKTTRPDTLWVGPDDPAKLAKILNNFLSTASQIQRTDLETELEKLHKLPVTERLAKLQALQAKANNLIDYDQLTLLADLEQGYGDAKYIRHAVTECIKNGISVLHIEDQGPKKRCGHLGDKELDTMSHYINILTAANYAAQEQLGPEQAQKQWVKFVARTDALSAKRIVFAETLKDPNHIDYKVSHKFIDWDRGFSEDGKYVHLKEGTNPATGNPYGLDHSVERCAEVVRRGLAQICWMETPDANIRVAKTFIENLNKSLESDNVKAVGLYNFSPSFIWDKGYYPDANKLAKKIGEFSKKVLMPGLLNGIFDEEGAKTKLREFLETDGDALQGDDNLSSINLDRMLGHALDFARDPNMFEKRCKTANKAITTLEKSDLRFRLKREVDRAYSTGFNPIHHITNIIVGSRISAFSNTLNKLNFKYHLITLPEYHYLAMGAYETARAYDEMGIEGYVKEVQRKEEVIVKTPNNQYGYLTHQKSTATGPEGQLPVNLGGIRSKVLDDSTEADFKAVNQKH